MKGRMKFDKFWVKNITLKIPHLLKFIHNNVFNIWKTSEMLYD